MSTTEGWNQRYLDDDTPWDLQSPSPSLVAALDIGMLHGFERVLVPGCGRGHDAELLARRGHDVVGVDFAPDAIAAFRERIAHAEGAAELRLEARQADVFALRDAEPAGRFDAVFEYTCFCAIDPDDRPRYVRTMSHLVRPGGRLLFLVFPTHREVEGGPPFAVTLEDVDHHFSESWTVRWSSPSQVAPGIRADREVVALLERKG